MNWKELLTPLNILIVLSGIILMVLIIIIILLLNRNRFKKRLLSVYRDPLLLEKEYQEYFTPARIMGRSQLIEKMALKYGIDLLQIIGINNLWFTELKKHKSKKLYKRVLNYYPERGLFTCFLIALERKDYAAILRNWLDDSEEFLITRRIALSGVGEEFSGEKALDFFREKLPQIREMTGDPLWASRYFAVKILLYDDSDQSSRAVWESIRDPHPLIRKTIASEFQTPNRDKLYNELFRLYLNDPVREVRAAAKDRINHDFTDVYNISIENLQTHEAIHALEHLSSFSKADEDTALRFLDHDNLELRFAAARFLEERGALKRLLEEADLGDRENLKRIDRLLRKSCEVHVSSFLELSAKTNNAGSLYVVTGILADKGEVSLIEPVCRKIFSMNQSTAENIELFDRALLCLNKRGSDQALEYLNDFLRKNRNNDVIVEKILKLLPVRGATIFISNLISFLEDDKFHAREDLRNAICRMDQDLYIQKMLEIIKSDRGTYSHNVRKDALKILIQLKQSFCLQTILENLPILPQHEAREIAGLLTEYDRNEFDRLTEILLESDDASVRSSLISCLPAVDGKSFIKEIRKSLGDADPEVRIASIWALVDFGETKTVSSAIAMLRDPVERVRMEVAMAIAGSGSDNSLLELKDVLFDENEVESVKIPAIRGLGFSESIKSIEILTELLDKTDDFNPVIIKALEGKTSKKEISRLIEIFKDGSPRLRDKLANAFSAMKEEGEEMMVSLLKEDITALKPHICEVLENTGFIENQIRFLKHRDPSLRRKAADELSYIGTASAFRGIVLAARDSDKDVRIAVTRALEQLNNSEGTEILKTLENDPDRKVRKYTAWALERLNSKNME
ncbi:HEAT repeat domain-containing protein [Spirochaeta isovalerica]|uniref:HEAT repeat protein n=1 Tax=Spirochaeta isovalerica TaxID=150 RepID=A0A841R4K8_9SPIO|nr:HEAT repeat domain-containing protein [Spirochaeta isovalerica]MBB6478746.1 HEAT repeat protein [Spirochaeta isovalerica]